MRTAVILGVLLAAATTGGASAHDYWIEPGTYRPAAGQPFAVSFRVGNPFAGQAVPFQAARSVKFVIAGETETPVIAREGGQPAALLRVEEPGLHVIAFQSRPRYLELAPERFEDYLREKGLEHVARARAERDESGKRSREMFSRSARSLVAVGEGADGVAGEDRPLGLPLELVAENNPYTSTSGETLSVRLLYRGEPLAGVLVIVTPAADTAHATHVRTDAAGRVEFPLTHAGPWQLSAVHMVPYEESSADWASLWASLTFEVPQRMR